MIAINAGMAEQYKGTVFGVLVLRGYLESAAGLQHLRAAAEDELAMLRYKHAGCDRKALSEADSTLAAYVRYYKQFKKTYHVLLQIESTLQGKGLPDAPGLIQALLLTELTTSLLIAGHDVRALVPPLAIDVAYGDESYTAAGGRSVGLKPNDICLKDQHGIVLSIIYGQDEPSRISEHTQDVLFFIDGVPGIARAVIEDGLTRLHRHIRTLSPTVVMTQQAVLEV